MSTHSTAFAHVEVEKVKAYWDARPCNIRHSQAEFGTKQYFDEIAAKKYMAEPHIREFAEYEKFKGKKVLEIGCGIGTMCTDYARAGAEMVCMDLSEKSVEVAKKRFEVMGLEGRFYCGNAEKLTDLLPEEDQGTFDLVVCWGVMHHTPYPDRLIQSVKSFVKEGGEFRVMIYSKFSYKLFWIMKETNQWDFGHMDEIVAKHSEAQTGSPVTYTYTFEDLKEALGEEFAVTKIWKDHIFAWSIPEYIQYPPVYVRSEEFKGMPEKDFRQMEKELGWHTMAFATYQPKK